MTDGTRRLKQDNANRSTLDHMARLIVAANTPEANAQKGKAWLGKPRPPHVRTLLRELAPKGRTLSAETRARMSAAHRARRRET